MQPKALGLGNMKGNQSLDAFKLFLETPLDIRLSQALESEAPNKAVERFRQVSKTVPAYQDFLKAYQIHPDAIQLPEDFASLPPVTKTNYLHKYPLNALCRNGQLTDCDMVAVSSGSTGSPTFWPRFLSDELEIATRFEQVFHDSFQADQRSTLAVICFALGTWVGGMYTANCCRYVAQKGYPITVVTPGNNKDEIFRVVTELGPLYDQVILLGYPPFLKDVVDTGRGKGIDWSPFRIGLVMAGEVFSEEWRSLMAERTGVTDIYYRSASLYGTADAGVLGNETPLSICIRRFLSSHPGAAKALFGESRLPTLVQYDPMSRYFECENRTLMFTGENGIPLIRYNILDTGGLVSYHEMLSFLAGYGFNPVDELKAQYGETARGIRELPFVYVFGRSNFTVSYFGANIYPENISVGLEQEGIKDWVTGKFVLQAREDQEQNRYLAIDVELAPHVEPSRDLTERIQASILVHLKRLNSEFTHYVPAEYQLPQVTLRPTGDPEYFPVGVKHRYTKPS